MAEKIVYTVDVDVRGDKELGALSKVFGGIQGNAENLSSSMSRLVGTQGTLKNSTDGLTTSTGNTTRELTTKDKSVKVLKKSMVELTTQTGALRISQESLNTTYDGVAPQTLHEFMNGTTKASKKLIAELEALDHQVRMIAKTNVELGASEKTLSKEIERVTALNKKSYDAITNAHKARQKEVKQAEELKRSKEKVGKAIEDNTKQNKENTKSISDNGGAIAILDRVTGGAASQFKNATGASKLFKGGLQGVGVALKALGIGLLVAAVAALFDVIRKQQPVIDFFKTGMETVSIVMNDVVRFFVGAVEPVKKFFSFLGSKPQKKDMESFGTAIKKNLIERFDSFIETLGLAASALTKLFKGDLKGAWADAKLAAKETFDVLTGVDGAFDKVADAVSNYSKKVIANAKTIVKLEKDSILLKAVNDGLIESYDIQAEKLRQVRDDETKTFKARREANEKLGKVLEKQGIVMKANAQSAINLAKSRDAVNSTDETKLALQEALNEQLAIEAKVTGQVSEQLVNKVALDKEQAEGLNELAKIGKEKRELAEIESQQELDAQLILIEKTVENEQEKYRLLQEAKNQHQARMLEYDIEANAKQAVIDEARRQDELILEQLVVDEKSRINQEYIDFLQSMSGLISAIGNQNEAMQKAALLISKGAAIADIVIKTQAANAAITTAEAAGNQMIAMKWAAVPFGGAAAAAEMAVNSGFAAKNKAKNNIMSGISIATIAATAFGQMSSGGSKGGSSGSGAVPQSPTFNVVGQSANSKDSASGISTNELDSRDSKPLKAYVVSTEMTSQQEADRNIEEYNTLG